MIGRDRPLWPVPFRMREPERHWTESMDPQRGERGRPRKGASNIIYQGKESDMRVVAVNVSEKKGTRKTSRPEVVLKTNWGVEGDSHADGTHRQLSLLGMEDIDFMRTLGADVHPGDFAENITTEGVDLASYPIGQRFRIGQDILLELTQIGKECHSGCEIRKLVGTCIMPKKGVFCRILSGGTVRPGDSFEVVKG